MPNTPQKVYCDGKEFESVKEFAGYYQLNLPKARYHFRRGRTPEEVISLCQFSASAKTEKKIPSTQYECEYGGVKYSSLYEAAMALGITPNQLYELRKRKNLTASEAIEWVMKNRKENGKRPGRAAKKCVVENVEYESREAAARAYHIPIITIYSRMERDHISFEEALIQGRNSTTYRAPVGILFLSLQFENVEDSSLEQQVLDDIGTSLVYYECQVQPVRCKKSGLPGLLVDGHTYVYFNMAAGGLEIISELPSPISAAKVNKLNAAYAVTKVFSEKGKTYLFSFMIAKDKKQDIKTCLIEYFSYASIRRQILKT